MEGKAKRMKNWLRNRRVTKAKKALSNSVAQKIGEALWNVENGVISVFVVSHQSKSVEDARKETVEALGYFAKKGSNASGVAVNLEGVRRSLRSWDTSKRKDK